MSRFDYIKFDDVSAEKLSDFKDRFVGLEKCCTQIKDGRAKSLVLTKLEEAYMWVGKAIRDEQIAGGGVSTDQPKRTDI